MPIFLSTLSMNLMWFFQTRRCVHVRGGGAGDARQTDPAAKVVHRSVSATPVSSQGRAPKLPARRQEGAGTELSFGPPRI
jgi:hypothetical protein